MDSDEIRPAPDLQQTWARAQETAAEDGYREVSVTRLLSAAVEIDTAGEASAFLDAGELREAEPSGATVGFVRDQRDEVMRAAALQAAANGSEEVRIADFLVASCMAVGDQAAALDGRRLAVSRVAQAQVSGAGLLASGELLKQSVTTAAVDKTNAWVESGRVGRFMNGGFGVTRGVVRSHKSTLEMILFFPGVLVREVLWVLLAWSAGTHRVARSALGVAAPSGLGRPVRIVTRLRMELLLHWACLLVGLLALAEWIIPREGLGLVSYVDLSLESEQHLIVTSLFDGGGVLGLGPWVPWAILAISLPSWESLLRMRWTSRFYGGPITRMATRAMLAIATPARPVEVTLSAVGLPGVIARGLVVILISTFVMRAWVG